jgi:transposase
MRHRSDLVEMTNQHIQHMHKALTQMNVQIQHVISDITGLTGLAIVDAMSRWPTAGQFVSWLALCPDNDITGGRVQWRGIRRVHNRAGELFRLAAYALHHDETPMGDYLRRMKSKLGPAGATTATAHKIAIIFLHDGEEASRIRCHDMGGTGRRARQTVRSETQTTGSTTGL